MYPLYTQAENMNGAPQRENANTNAHNKQIRVDDAQSKNNI